MFNKLPLSHLKNAAAYGPVDDLGHLPAYLGKNFTV